MGSDLGHEVRCRLSDDDYHYLHIKARLHGQKGLSDIVKHLLEIQIEIEKAKDSKLLASLLKPKQRQ